MIFLKQNKRKRNENGLLLILRATFRSRDDVERPRPPPPGDGVFFNWDSVTLGLRAASVEVGIIAAEHLSKRDPAFSPQMFGQSTTR